MFKKIDQYPTNKEIVYLLGIGTLLVGSIIFPGLAVAGGAIVRAKRRHDFLKAQRAWKKFNLPFLRRNLKRLQKQKVVEIVEQNGQKVVKLTEKGRSQYLKFKLEQLSLKGQHWDGKWRLVIYDISKLKRSLQENFRRILKRINFLQIQKSVYLTPFKCREEIEYLRQYLNLADEVLYFEVSKIENEKYYKEYFGL